MTTRSHCAREGGIGRAGQFESHGSRPGALQCHAETFGFRRGQPHDADALSSESLHDHVGDRVIHGLARRVEGQQQIGERLAHLGSVYRAIQQQSLHLAGMAGESRIAEQPAGSRKLVHGAGGLVCVEPVVQVQQ